MADYLIHLATIIGIWSILAVSLDLVVGYTGLLSMAQVTFCGIGAYTSAILMAALNVNFFVSILAAMIVAGLASFLIGLVLNKFRGDYYALGSLGFNAIVFSVFLNWKGVTNGPLGISGIFRPELFGVNFYGGASFLLLVLLILGIVFALSRFIVNSSFGRVLKAIREDEETAQAFGYDTTSFKLAVFIISAAMAGAGGALFASYYTFIDPFSFKTMQSIVVLAMIILGGLANLRGALVGSIFLVILPEALRFVGFPTDVAAQMQELTYGIILVSLMLFRPQGIIGEYKM
jgi:branched-chain amino acid transport system permease protein